MRPWKRDEVDALLTWMGDHKEVVRGKMNKWCQQVKEDVFKENTDVQWTKIKDKYHNMRRQWLQARKIYGAPEYLIKEGDVPEDMRAKMVSKCPNFFRLEEILVLSQGVPDGFSSEYAAIANDASPNAAAAAAAAAAATTTTTATGPGDGAVRPPPPGGTNNNFRVPLAPKPPRSDNMAMAQARQLSIFNNAGPPSQSPQKRPASSREESHENVDVTNMVDMRQTEFERLLSPQELSIQHQQQQPHPPNRKRPRTSSPEMQQVRDDARGDVEALSALEERMLRSQLEFEQRLTTRLSEFHERITKQQQELQRQFQEQQGQLFDQCLQTHLSVMTDAVGKITENLFSKFKSAN